MKRKLPVQIERVIMEAIRSSGMTYLELSIKSKINVGTISRFMSADPANRRTLTLPNADPLCRALGLELKPKTGSKDRRNSHE